MTEVKQYNKRIKFNLFNFFIYTYVLLLPIGTGLSGIIGSISIMNYIAVGILICGIIYSLNQRTIKVNKNIIPTLLYFLYTVISVMWSAEVTFNWYVVTNIVNFLLFFVLNTHQWEYKEIEKINIFIVLSQIIVFWAVIKNISSIYYYRLSITIVSTIGISDFACGLCLMIAMWMSVASSTNKKHWRIIAFASIVFDIVIIIMAGSRGALVMVVVMAIVWVLLGNYSTRIKLIIIVVMVSVLLLYDEVFVDLLPATITSRLTFSAIQSSHGSGRFNVWKLAWDTFKNSNVIQIIIGHGFDSFLYTVSYGEHGGYKDLMAHNVVIQTMIEGGIVGIILLFYMMFSQLRLAWKNNDNMMKIAIVGLFVASLSIDMQVTRIWGFILALNCIRQVMDYQKTE